jgi:MFS family permease
MVCCFQFWYNGCGTRYVETTTFVFRINVNLIIIIGIDEGLISGTFNQKNFQHKLQLDKLTPVALANVKGNVSAMVQIGSVAGAALAFVLADRIGRLWATRQLCLLWIVGIVIFLTNNGSLGQVYAGRFIAGKVSSFS